MHCVQAMRLKKLKMKIDEQEKIPLLILQTLCLLYSDGGVAQW